MFPLKPNHLFDTELENALNDEFDDYAEQSLYMIGTVDEAKKI
ncbi:MAG: hypothetical protein QNJ53_29900 [Pleurocapsa sp. MO_192.B19]|nr:hypothetical protein [Pleurocapsa sp. MO_192.B19]